jgi:hypothetical protein
MVSLTILDNIVIVISFKSFQGINATSSIVGPNTYNSLFLLLVPK